MKMMKMMVVLVLSGVLWVSADVLHEDSHLVGCSDSGGEDMYGLDGEEVWYADFKHNKGVEPQPPFVDPMTYPGGYEQAVANLEICKQNLKVARQAYKEFPLEKDPPSSHMIYTRDKVEPGQKNSLICHVTGFYPAPVEFSWTKNEENVTEGSSTNVPFVNKDGTFNQFSTLEFTPQLGDIYGCTVKHLALDQPQTKFYDVQQTQPSSGPAVFCGVGLTVGLLGVAAGTFFLIKGNECS
ncbi:HLA class II histocompatibility antigen, DP alpha 1 chain-like [Anarrhichthys ocellatus]|uniref:HLA class II histocompatibility antigen, DP alpha 1 chain-like n=1 Tax=Anarrhichthys ocellatus TaxID=433405 RepID=UPI0012ED06B1|nr:HLA class II histocompatibility antigen, DP alpha 1 chain-like [Anarrhichthys ocellatus]XP_031734491.1 HLA class II histocompatibility antigen, DP alpha 1 chain-like [Anarrhichthys ocellatus]